MIEVKQCSTCGHWQTLVNGNVKMEAFSKSICERYARIMAHCRETSYRAAIKILMEDIGFSEEEAKVAYIEITEHRSTGVMQ